MKRGAGAAPLTLVAAGLDGARLALASPARRGARARRVLVCAAVMTMAALAFCAVVLGGWSPETTDVRPTEVRAPLSR